jgi:hypothetical protein
VFYDTFQPKMINITNINNSAPYGPNIASYAYTIKKTSSPSFIAASNQVYNSSITFDLLDVDGQLMNKDDLTMVVLKSNSSALIIGSSALLVKGGKVTFTGLIFKGKIGSSNNMIATSAQINYPFLSRIF